MSLVQIAFAKKSNIATTKVCLPFDNCRLKGSSNITGFKKGLYNSIKVQYYRLKPSYNRRKHRPSHYILINNSLNKLSKTLGYVNTNKIHFWIAYMLKTTCSTAPNANYSTFLLTARSLGLGFSLLEEQQQYKTFSADETLYEGQWQAQSCGNNFLKLVFFTITRSIPYLVTLIETESVYLLWKNMFSNSLRHSQQSLRHSKSNIFEFSHSQFYEKKYMEDNIEAASRAAYAKVGTDSSFFSYNYLEQEKEVCKDVSRCAGSKKTKLKAKPKRDFALLLKNKKEHTSEMSETTDAFQVDKIQTFLNVYSRLWHKKKSGNRLVNYLFIEPNKWLNMGQIIVRY